MFTVSLEETDVLPSSALRDMDTGLGCSRLEAGAGLLSVLYTQHARPLTVLTRGDGH